MNYLFRWVICVSYTKLELWTSYLDGLFAYHTPNLSYEMLWTTYLDGLFAYHTPNLSYELVI